VQRDGAQDTPEYAWLSTLLSDRPHLLPNDIRTEVSVFDVDFDGRVPNPQFGPLPDPTFEWLQKSRNPSDRVRILYIGIENEDLFDTTIIDALAMKYNLDPIFFLDHFLPSLWSDRRIVFKNQPLSWVPPVPSEHVYLRFKDCEGRNISAAFVCTDIKGADKTGELHCILLFLLAIWTYSSNSDHSGANRDEIPAPGRLQVCTM
jgi:hypothetical protein